MTAMDFRTDNVHKASSHRRVCTQLSKTLDISKHLRNRVRLLREYHPAQVCNLRHSHLIRRISHTSSNTHSTNQERQAVTLGRTFTDRQGASKAEVTMKRPRILWIPAICITVAQSTVRKSNV
ncbi:uncharacterized protein MYCFIDRAFT_209705 [Pseudocercospora fijiensis CIRAD86]|uniref:Uncharacterized protein n=1 Tax=Pseudocercospora fijiensis (strain CIRAD86) TaxID=383855 RepID=N1Q6M2_PSEFD|nr:uncharacterized protein MYCFIDRAFT_209705 [Pseudocercospora fijiensis CIRAD86]EME88095.1 hypothetical protein MYCFIDRAFT_209705 [Pseudocercospora fijiensis CIRAD86]